MGRSQIEGAPYMVCRSRHDGCSTTANPPATRSSAAKRSAQNNSALPTSTCLSCLKVHPVLHHGQSTVRSGGGPSCLKRATDQVSHGGPATCPMTLPSLICFFQKPILYWLVKSPRSPKTTSSDSTTVVYPWHRTMSSMACCKSLHRRLPEKRCKTK